MLASQDLKNRLKKTHQILLNEYIKKNDATVNKLKTEVDQVTLRLVKTEATVKELEEQVTFLSDDLETARELTKRQQDSLTKLEKSERDRIEERKRANIIVDGIPEGDDKPPIDSVKELLSDIGVNLQANQVLTAFRIGAVNKVNKTRPRGILVKLSSPTTKYEIYKCVKYLKDDEKGKKVFISDDLPKEIAEQRKILRTLAASARDGGHRAMVTQRAQNHWLNV